MPNKKRKKLKNQFNSKDSTWRIEAVIHDGNWYDIGKWSKVAKVDQEELKDWIKQNENILIKSSLGSYRVNYNQIIKWYKEQNLDPEESLVPSNFPPKLWGQTTETDVFSNAPRRRVGTVSFFAESPEIYNKCIQILRGIGKIMPDKDGRHKAHGLSASYMKSLLSKGLTELEYESLDIKTRAVLMQRELIDLPDDWLEHALDFYGNTFAPSVLKSSMSTISIYLPDREEIRSQTLIWIITAMKKFDEEASVPFSGYLSNVLRHWPYDLPDEHLGKELSRFQRERKKAIDEVESETNGANKGDIVPIEKIADIMKIPMEEYIMLNGEHENWLAEKNATTLTWQDSANEKKGEILGVQTTPESDIYKMFNLSISIIKAAVDTEDWNSAYEMIAQLDTNDIDSNVKDKLSPEFIAKFAQYLGYYKDN